MDKEPYLILMVFLTLATALMPRRLRPEVVGLSFVATGLLVGRIAATANMRGSRFEDFVLLILLSLIPPGLIMAGLGWLSRVPPPPRAPESKLKTEPELPVPSSRWRRRVRLAGFALWAVAMAVALTMLGRSLQQLPW